MTSKEMQAKFDVSPAVMVRVRSLLGLAGESDLGTVDVNRIEEFIKAWRAYEHYSPLAMVPSRCEIFYKEVYSK